MRFVDCCIANGTDSTPRRTRAGLEGSSELNSKMFGGEYDESSGATFEESAVSALKK